MGRPRICCARAAQDHAAPPTLSQGRDRRRSIACPRASRWSPPKYGEWREGTAEALPFPDRSFDVAVSQFGLMFFTDRDKAIHEMLRVMAAGGRCVVAVWDAIENAPPFAVLVGLLDRIAGKAAGDALRAPFVLGDRRALAALFSGAGASSVDITTRQGTARFPSTRELVEAELRGWLPVMGVVLPEPEISLIVAEAEKVLAPYVTRDGAIAFSMSAHLVSSRKP